MANTLKLVLTDYWFEEIKSGRKTHEYRKWTQYFVERISKRQKDGSYKHCEFVEFQKAYRKNPERMLFKIKNVSVINGKDTDLHIDDYVYDIELGERVK